VVALINEFKAMGATASGSGGSSSSIDFGWLLPLDVLLVLAFLMLRLIGK
jgi:hypothetical protein